MKRREFLASLVIAPVLTRAAMAANSPVMTVSKSPTCGCCGAWVQHIRAAGFEVDVRELPDEQLAALKRNLGLAPEHTACHTAQIDGYVVEGHVPAADVQRLLAERPEALGLTVPGMPAGSPGMAMGDQRDPFDTLLIRRDGTAEIFARH